MLFDIVHKTVYRYSQPASEACAEARLSPPRQEGQRVIKHELVVEPEVGLLEYTDTFDNRVHFFALGRRHEELSITNKVRVETKQVKLPDDALDLTVAEARQILSSGMVDLFGFLQSTEAVPVGGKSHAWAKREFKGKRTLRDALEGLNAAIYHGFRYEPGATEVSTPLAEVWKQKAGVCQDFAHIMLSILRTAGLPARYVCGYIESAPPEGEALVGSVATHAWVEVLLPGLNWVGLDPTNNKWLSPQHVTVSYGRDFADAAPVRGTFKGSGTQKMAVKVRMRRLREKRIPRN